MSIIINHPHPEDGPGTPVPPPWRLRQIFAMADWLYQWYGRPPGEWPPPETWPCPAGASRECTVCGGRDGNHYPWCGHAHHLPGDGAR